MPFSTQRWLEPDAAFLNQEIHTRSVFIEKSEVLALKAGGEPANTENRAPGESPLRANSLKSLKNPQRRDHEKPSRAGINHARRGRHVGRAS